MDICLIKQFNNALYPATPADVEKLAKVKSGEGIICSYKKPRNFEFHKKYFALLNYAFDIWEPPEEAPAKNFDRFREEVTMAAGHYNVVPSIKGDTRYIAKSISFAAMDEIEFQDLYEKSVSFLLKYVLKNYTREDLDAVLLNLSEFA